MLFLVGASTAFATHFRGATLSWVRDTSHPAASPNHKFIVTYTAAMRWSFPWGISGGSCGSGNTSCPAVGTSLGSALGQVTFQHPTTNVGIGVRINSEAASLVTTTPLTAVVTKVIPAQDLLFAEYTFAVYVPEAAPVMPRVRWENGDRLSTLLEGNNDRLWRVESVLNLVATKSPAAVMTPTVPVKTGVLNTFTIPTTGEPNTTVELSIASLAESQLFKAQPTGFAFSNVSPNTVEFTPPVSGLYAVQIKATGYDAANNARSSAPLDFILQATSCTGTCPFVNVTTPATTVTVEIGQTLSLPVTVTAGNMSPTSIIVDSTPLPSNTSVSFSAPPQFPTVTATYSWTPDMSDLGSYPVCFQGIAGVTNSAPLCVVINAVVHNDPPAAVCSAPLNVPATSPAGAAAMVFATISDPDLNALTVSWKVNGNPAGFENFPSGSSGGVQADLNFVFPIGLSTVEATVNDGFATATCTTSVSVDKLAQNVVFNPPSTVPYGTASILLMASGPTNNTPSFQVQSGPGNVVGNTLFFTGVGPAGVGEVQVLASILGNAIYEAGSALRSIFVVDEEPPSVNASAPAPTEATGPSGAVVTFGAFAFDNVDDPISPTCVPASGSTFPVGSTPVNCSATDAAGNTGSTTISVEVVDTTPPAVDGHGDESAEATSPGGAVVTFTSPNSLDLVSGPGTADCVPASGSTFVVGSTAVTCTAYDAAGNDTSTSFTVNVADTTPPSIDDNADLTVEADDANGAVVTFGNPAATDLVDTAVTVTCVPASGSLFAQGQTTVTCTATDDYNNSASSSFTVTVSDTVAPVVNDHPDIPAEATSAAGAVVTFTPPTSLDAIDGAGGSSCLPASGSTFGFGPTPVICSRTDNAGNTGSSEFIVTVADTIAPTIDAHAGVTAEAAGPAGGVATYTPPNSHDAVDGVVAASCVPASGSNFPLGPSTVTCSRTDAHGNPATPASFTVTVVDTTDPVVTYSGNAGTYNVTQTVNITCAASDAVGVTGNTCAPISGPALSFGVGTHTFSATATDAAGNVGTGSTTFTVISTLETLQQLVNSYCDNPGICNALNAKLTAAANANNANARAGQLGAFVNQVNAQTGKCLTPAEAAILLQLVQAFY
jgi:hypothetical protein